MIHHLSGRLIEKSPTHAIVECGGIGYFLHISLHTFSQIPDRENCTLFAHQVIRDDAHMLFGFYDKEEREVFLQLISVSGVGATTGRMILSSLSPTEVQHAIMDGDVGLIQKIKGIGAKTAQRIIVDLQDKIGKTQTADREKLVVGGNSARSEALTALSSLGFDKKKTETTVDRILKQAEKELAVEDLIKSALKQL